MWSECVQYGGSQINYSKNSFAWMPNSHDGEIGDSRQGSYNYFSKHIRLLYDNPIILES